MQTDWGQLSMAYLFTRRRIFALPSARYRAIVCAQDMAMPADLHKEFAPKAREVLELSASHSPFPSVPAALADMLAASFDA